MRIAVVVPMYNEEAGAERCVTSLSQVLAGLGNDAALVVVDDGSCDATLDRLDAQRRTAARVDIVVKEQNEGYGAALRTGAAHADSIGAEWVIFMDSDLTNPPAQIADFVAAMSDDLDLIKACRYCAGGGMVDVPFRRRVFSRAGNLVARALAGGPHRDPTNGFRAFRTRSYLALPLKDRGFSVILEELFYARRLGLRGADIPTLLSDRSSDLRPSSFHYSPRQMWAYLRWPLRTAADRLHLVSGGRR
jgi:dolichol-phosphate mannosyltransferase